MMTPHTVGNARSTLPAVPWAHGESWVPMDSTISGGPKTLKNQRLFIGNHTIWSPIRTWHEKLIHIRPRLGVWGPPDGMVYIKSGPYTQGPPGGIPRPPTPPQGTPSGHPGGHRRRHYRGPKGDLLGGAIWGLKYDMIFVGRPSPAPQLWVGAAFGRPLS